MAKQEISENIKRAQNIIRAVDDTVITLGNISRLDFSNWSAWMHAWNDLLFGRRDKRNASNQARRNVADMKFLMDDFISALKNISGKVPEYEFNDYGINQEFADFYNYCKNTDMNKIKNYKPDKDTEILTGISAKAAKIKGELSDLKEKIQ